MFKVIKTKIKEKTPSENKRYIFPNKQLPNQSPKRNKLKKNRSKMQLPPINQNIDIATKIKKATLKKSISYLYKSLFPDEKNSMDEFLNNFSYDKFLHKPDWKYTFSPFKDEEIIKKDLMTKNSIMKFYNKMKKPSKIKKEFKRKPRMVQIIEDNYSYKNRQYENLLDDNFSLRDIKNKLKLELNINGKENEEDSDEEEGEKSDYNLIGNTFYANKSRNRINFNNIYRGNIYPLMKSKVMLSPLSPIKIKDGEKHILFRNITTMKKENLFFNQADSIEEE